LLLYNGYEISIPVKDNRFFRCKYTQIFFVCAVFSGKVFLVKRYFELDRKIYPEKKDFRLIKREKDLQRSLI